MTITEFLTARYDEEEALASALLIDLQSQVETDWKGQVDEQGPMTPDRMLKAQLWRDYDGQTRWRNFARGQAIARLASPDRALADIAAKRAIVAYAPRVDHLVSTIEWEYSSNVDEEGDDLLRILAQPFAEHPDFDPAWRVA
jgi:hypothetical protein